MLFVFQRYNSDIEVKYKTDIRNASNMDEQFAMLLLPSTVDTYLERKLFYSFDRKRWTLNEIIFFCNNNNLCLSIYADNGNYELQYGICGGVEPVLGDFSNDFNRDYNN